MTNDEEVPCIRYVKGDARTVPFDRDAPRVPHLVHIVNDIGKWESGFAAGLAEVHPVAKDEYLRWYADRHRTDEYYTPFELGNIRFVKVGYEQWVVNLIGQHSRIQDGEEKPIRYDAVRKGLATLAHACLYEDDDAEGRLRGEIHMPRIGTGRARGDWSEIEKIIKEEVISRGIFVTVYDWDES